MRVKLFTKDLKRLFKAFLEKENLNNFAMNQNVSIRTVNNWKRGKLSMPKDSFDHLLNISGIDKIDLSPMILPDFWHIRGAAKKGAIERMKKYGNFGTPEGRRLGGLNSLKIHNKIPGRFRLLKSIKKPKYSEKLAEFLGILIGDGHLSQYQASVTTNSKTDREHALFVQDIIKNLFGISSTLKDKRGENTINIVASSKKLVIFLNQRGMPIGNKIKNNVSIPAWILQNVHYQKAFIRGLFDTDGCIYLDIHKVKNKVYRHLGWTITSASNKLIVDILSVLRNLDFSPTNQITQKSVYLRRKKDIERYFNEVGTSNPKHHKRYIKFIGGVPKWS